MAPKSASYRIRGATRVPSCSSVPPRICHLTALRLRGDRRQVTRRCSRGQVQVICAAAPAGRYAQRDGFASSPRRARHFSANRPSASFKMSSVSSAYLLRSHRSSWIRPGEGSANLAFKIGKAASSLPRAASNASQNASSKRLTRRLRLLQPEGHVHLAVHRRRSGEVLARGSRVRNGDTACRKPQTGSRAGSLRGTSGPILAGGSPRVKDCRSGEVSIHLSDPSR